MKFAAIIPARYASTRFPAKPLAVLGGKPVVIRVCEQASKVFDHVFVATDDERIFNAVLNGGFTPIMTRSDHKSGTDRCYEAFCKCGVNADVVVNIQGDEPFIQPSQLQTIKSLFESPDTDIATLVKPFASNASFETVANPNSPKVVVDDNWNALYFSRSVIPYLRGIPEQEWPASHTFYKHIGLYAFKANVLKAVTELPQAPLEKAESLEQLRWLSAGYRIKVGVTDVETIGIDTPDDLAAAERFLKQQSQ
ncbi:MAG: 3-deoxy-manno-octulosonate cytidylyltransferase [Bacteroidaceae bacterium]|jgi:3-deoxy-manno-octulosonate cytidylyltransferase (CMP-KDO synthetase)|nr:3-deoxy-manno-octulosonate cytidylyltransferase [Bacteroidaceae bacterium]